MGDETGMRWEHRSARERRIGIAGLALGIGVIVSVGVMAAVGKWQWSLLNALPMLTVVWSSARAIRARVIVDDKGVAVQGAIWTRTRPWNEITGFRWGKSGQIAAAMVSGDLVHLPGVRVRGSKSERAERAEAMCQELDALRPEARVVKIAP